MKESDKITEQDIAQAKVKLSAVFGIRPRMYVPAAYALVLLAAVFFILVNPALRNPGAELVFKGAPEASAVYIDGSYAGNTLDGARAAPGNHDIEIKKAGFSAQTLKVQVPNRIFATLIFPPKVSVRYELSATSVSDILLPAFKNYATWSLTGRPSDIYQLPMSLSEVSRDLSALPLSARMETAAPLLAASLGVAENSTSLRDAIYASAELGAPGASPLSILALARDAAGLLAHSKRFALALSEIVPEKTYPGIKDAVATLAQDSAGAPISGPVRTGSRSAGPLTFVMFAAGSASTVQTTPGGAQLPLTFDTPEFGLSTTEVTRAEYARFLAQNPVWRPENRDALIKEGLADASYLATYDAAKNDAVPITGVSWYAATAYCDWLSAQAPAGYSVQLPSESMWAAAAAVDALRPAEHATFSDRASTGPLAVGSSGRDSLGFADLYGNVWEWTADGFRAYPWIADSSAAFASLTASIDEKTVRGGSWANKPDDISAGSRGPVPSAHASEFLGFRPALVRK